MRQSVIGHLIKDVLEVLRIESGNFEVPQRTEIFPRNVIELASLVGPALYSRDSLNIRKQSCRVES